MQCRPITRMLLEATVAFSASPLFCLGTRKLWRRKRGGKKRAAISFPFGRFQNEVDPAAAHTLKGQLGSEREGEDMK